MINGSHAQGILLGGIDRLGLNFDKHGNEGRMDCFDQTRKHVEVGKTRELKKFDGLDNLRM